jgi:hypothetical protein
VLVTDGYGSVAAMQRFNEWLHDDGRIDRAAVPAYRCSGRGDVTDRAAVG